MTKFLLIPAIILLACCVSVGAFNAVSGSNNRPMTFNESLVTLSEVDISIDDMSILIDSIQDAWATESASIYPSQGGVVSGGSRDESNFGEKNYEADTGTDWIDSFLNFLSDFCFTLVTLINILVLLVKDTISIVVTFFDLMVKFFFGVPT